MALVIMFSMPGCGYCTKAKKILSDDIASGKVVVKPHTDAKGVSGFPHFTNSDGTKTHTGCPTTSADLHAKLGTIEGFRTHAATPSRGAYFNASQAEHGSYSIGPSCGHVTPQVAGQFRANGLPMVKAKGPDLTMGVF